MTSTLDPGDSAGATASRSDLERWSAPSAPPIPTRLGRFFVDGVLGRGGLGVVLVGRDPQLDRRVALKLVRADAVTRGPDGRARLLREARTLAQLAHPNVVRVYDVGWESERVAQPRLFLAMEYVEGRTLHAWLHTTPRSWREIVAKFLPAGRGVAAVHDAGLVHRDVKPSNVLVADDGRVLLADFGLVMTAGRAPEIDLGAAAPSDSWSASGSGDMFDDPVTRPGMVLGTMHYMAPEQRRGDKAEPQSDQFSFCVALADALWGRAQGGRAGIGRGATDAARIPKRLRRAIARGRSFAPGDRFATTGDLLFELEAALHGGSRGPWIAGALAAATVASIVAVLPADPACEDAKTLHDALWGPARQAIVAETLAPTLPPHSESWSRLRAELERTTSAWADAAAQTCTAALAEPAEPTHQARLACLEGIRTELSGIVEALEQPGPQTWMNALQTVHDMRSTCADGDDVPAGIDTGAPELASVRALLDVGHHHEAHAAAQLAIAEHPHDPHVQAEASWVLGVAALLDGANDDAARHFEHAYWIALEHERTPWAARMSALASTSMIRASWMRGEPARAEVWTRHAAAAVARAQPEVRLADELALEEAAFRSHLGRTGRAETLVDGVLARAAERPGSEDLWRRALGMRIELLTGRGEYERALKTAELELQLARVGVGNDHPATARALAHVAMAHDAAGRKEQSLVPARDALRILEAAYGPDHVEVARLTASLGNTLQGAGRVDEARPHLERALAVFEQTWGPRHRATAELYGLLATNAAARGDLEAADRLSAQELDVLEQWLPPHTDEIIEAKGARAELALLRQHYEDAERIARDAIRGARAQGGTYGSQEIEVLNVLLRAWLEQGKPAIALAESERAYAAIAARGETSSRDAALMLAFQGQAQLDLGRPTAAARTLLAAAQAIDEGGMDQGFVTGDIRLALATALERSGQIASARAAARLAVETYRAIEDREGLADAEMLVARLTQGD